MLDTKGFKIYRAVVLVVLGLFVTIPLYVMVTSSLKPLRDVQGAFTWLSLGRYVLPAVGVYVAVALWLAGSGRSGWVRDIVLVASALLMGLLAVLYATGFWIV